MFIMSAMISASKYTSDDERLIRVDNPEFA
jgi:hypothetical protein